MNFLTSIFKKNVGFLAFLAERFLQTASISLKNHLRRFQKYTQNIYKIYRTSKKQAKIENTIQHNKGTSITSLKVSQVERTIRKIRKLL